MVNNFLKDPTSLNYTANNLSPTKRNIVTWLVPIKCHHQSRCESKHLAGPLIK